jgi:molybdate/tungstate transport system ATP-binding protein
MIRLLDVTVRAGEFVLRNITLEIPQGQYVVLMGKTGCGKTTLLETICGLRQVEQGTIEVDGRDITRLRPGERNIGFVPQDVALFPSMNVRNQLAFALKLRGYARAEIHARVAQLAAELGIDALLDRKPQGLSGGEAQRVALGRAIAAWPKLLSLDEPIHALDRSTHRRMCEFLRRQCRETNLTAVHVTHDPEEARTLADRIVVLEEGKIRL